MAESLVGLRDRRDEVIARLSDAYAQDLFDVDELDRRLDLAHSARTVAELDALAEDLGPAAALATTSTALAIDDAQRPAVKAQRVIMGSIERGGRWTVARRMKLRVFWGNAELDFREASIAPGITEIEIHCTMGNVELILPPDLAIEVDVSSLMGNVEEKHRKPVDHDPNRPMLRVTGRVTMGNLEITTLLRGETKRDLRQREREDRWDRRRERRLQRRLGKRAPRELPPGRSDM